MSATNKKWNGFQRWKERTGDDRCGYCDFAGPDVESGLLMFLVCPGCSREGCGECMPAGRGCRCPECDDVFTAGGDDAR